MLATGHQPVFMPWLGLLHKIASADVFISWDDVQAEDSGFENRQEILTAKGRQWITVPVRKGRDLKIRELTIVNEQPWRRKHWRTIELAYSGAPFWAVHSEFLRYVYSPEAEEPRVWKTLAELNATILGYLLTQFRIRSPRLFTLSGLNVEGEKNDLIIAACRAVGANQYLFGARGVDYADKAAFLAAGIEPFVQTYDCVPYKQPSPVFVDKLWAFDVLMNVERDRAIEIMMAGGKTGRMA